MILYESSQCTYIYICVCLLHTCSDTTADRRNMNLFCSGVCIIQSEHRAGRAVIVPCSLASVQFTTCGSMSCHRSLVIFMMYSRRTGVAGHSVATTGWTNSRVRWNGHGVDLPVSSCEQCAYWMGHRQECVRWDRLLWLFSLSFLLETAESAAVSKVIALPRKGLACCIRKPDSTTLFSGLNLSVVSVNCA